MNNQTKGVWYRQNGIALMGDDGIHICDVKGLSRTDSENEANTARIVACINACDGYTTGQLQALAGGNVKREVTHFADRLCEAEGRYLKAERLNAKLLTALKDLLEHEGTTDSTGIGEFPAEALGVARQQAQDAIEEAAAYERGML